MFVQLAHSVSLQDGDNFSAFHLEAPATLSPEEINAMLETCDAGSCNSNDHAWVSIAWLTSQGRATDEWRNSFDAMLSYAQSKGWCSENGELVRAHIERIS